MSSQAPTIIDLKTSFLRSQVLALSQPFRISPETLDRVTSAEENALRQKTIDAALAKANALLRKHNKRVYGPQALRHVSEQIDQLYWRAGDQTMIVAGGEDWGEKGADYR
jgi:hypothetical protein